MPAVATPTTTNIANQAVPSEQLAHQTYPNVKAMVKAIQPSFPVHIFRPHAVKRVTSWFIQTFPGKTLYAVKTNPTPHALAVLYQAGVRHFDVASLPEIQQVHSMFPDATMYYMHPVKSREAISEAYHQYGVRDFSLDSFEELHKILEMTTTGEVDGTAPDLGLHIRLALPKGSAAHDLSGKFGANMDEAEELLRLARKVGKRVGICFHVGSQCMDPTAYDTAIAKAAELVKKSGIKLDVLDVGGGFPSIYPGLTPPDLSVYINTIRASVHAHFGANKKGMGQPELWCEPGRALVAEGGSVVVRVELRKKNALYINDGTYGTLFDAGSPGMVFPTRLVREGHIDNEEGGSGHAGMTGYKFFGPTCDSLDTMNGPFALPDDVVEGDWIEIGQLGAYGSTLQTRFNGFYSDHTVVLEDEPVMSLNTGRFTQQEKTVLTKEVA